jgi:hypothetical protein
MIDFMNLRDLANTNDFTTRFSLPKARLDVQIASGIAYIAGGDSGLHVVNYVGFDNLGVPPTVSATGPEGASVTEGSFVPIRIDVTDDVQVREVELLTDGLVVAYDASAPFDLRAVTPSFLETEEGIILGKPIPEAADAGSQKQSNPRSNTPLEGIE